MSGRSYRNTRRWAFLIGGVFALLQACATAPSVSPDEEARAQAKISYLLGDYQRTLAITLPKAEAGEPWAQYTLGYMYYYGRGIVQDRQLGKRWIESAAAKDYAPAQQAMQRLAAPPPRTEDENNAITNDIPTSSEDATSSPSAAPQNKAPATTPGTTQPTPESSPPPGEQLIPINPPMPEPSATPGQETTPSSSTVEPLSAPPAPDHDPTPAPDSVPGQTPQSSSPSADTIQPQTSTSSSGAARTVQPASLNKGIKGRDWLSRQDPRYFTLQLASSLDKDAIIRLIRKQGIEQQAAYYSTKQNGRTWYSLVYGNFSSRSAAHQAMRKLPRALRRDSPRIRSFREIHAQLSPTL